MSEEKQHRSLFNRHKEDGGEQAPKSADQYGEGIAQTAEKDKALKGEKYHKHMEELAAGGAVATGGFALHEKHEEKKDPEHARRHKIEEEAAAAATVGETGYGFHEHHDEKGSKEEEKKAEGKKQHHLF